MGCGSGCKVARRASIDAKGICCHIAQQLLPCLLLMEDACN